MTPLAEPAPTSQSTALNEPPLFLLGISGPSSAGKTTLAHLLSSVFTSQVQLLLHGDNFCKDISFIPTYNGYIDTDGPSGVDFEKLGRNIGLRQGEREQAARESYELAIRRLPGPGSEGATDVTLGDAKYTIVIMEGFLLYHRSDVRRRLDGKLFVPLDHQEARRRRLTRPSYGAEAEEGEFRKTEEYFENMVWRNHVEQHADLFEDGNAEGSIDRKVCSERGIALQEAMNTEMGQTLSCAVDIVISLLKAHQESPLG